MTSLASLAAENGVPELHEHELPMAHWAYGAISLAVFFALLGFLWMFRNAAAGFGSDGADPHAEGARGDLGDKGRATGHGPSH